MSQRRLTDLTLLNIHRNIPTDTIKLIERFSKANRKSLDFVIEYCNLYSCFIIIYIFILKLLFYYRITLF